MGKHARIALILAAAACLLAVTVDWVISELSEDAAVPPGAGPGPVGPLGVPESDPEQSPGE